MSERRACQLVGQNRSTQRYERQPAELELRLVKRMNELASEHPRYGYRRVWALLRSEGFAVNRKRVERLWRLGGHSASAARWLAPSEPARSQRSSSGSSPNMADPL